MHFFQHAVIAFTMIVLCCCPRHCCPHCLWPYCLSRDKYFLVNSIVNTFLQKKIMQDKKKMVKTKSQSTFTEKRKTRSKYRVAARVAAEALKRTAYTRLRRQTQEKVLEQV